MWLLNHYWPNHSQTIYLWTFPISESFLSKIRSRSIFFVMNSILHSILNMPSVSRAGLQTALLLTDWFIFSSKSSNYQNIIAKVTVLFWKLKYVLQLSTKMQCNRCLKQLWTASCSKLVVQNPRRRLVVRNNCRKLVVQNTHRKSVVQNTRRKLVVQNTHRELVVQNNHSKLVVQDTCRKFVVQNTRRKLVAQNARRMSLVQNTRRKSVVQNTRRKSIVQNTCRKSVVQNTHRKSVVQITLQYRLFWSGRLSLAGYRGSRSSSVNTILTIWAH